MKKSKKMNVECGMMNVDQSKKSPGWCCVFHLPYSKPGFTLVELLVVISIIGILAALALVSFTGAQKQARDTQRKSNLKQYATTLESFANSHDELFPDGNVPQGIWIAETDSCLVLGLSNCPEDPKYDAGDPVYSDWRYRYQSNGGSSDFSKTSSTKYVLWSYLESNRDVYWIYCSDGKTGEIGIDDAVILSGNCPL